MQARISLSEPALLGDSSAQVQDDSARAIYGLIQAGVVTHRFKSSEKIDLIFATAELYDLPEIAFVAAFKSGALYIGCPDGPPESLAFLIETVAADDAPHPTITDRTTDIETEIDQLNEGLDDKMNSTSQNISNATDQNDAPDDAAPILVAPPDPNNTHTNEQSEPVRTPGHEDALDAAFCEDADVDKTTNTQSILEPVVALDNAADELEEPSLAEVPKTQNVPDDLAVLEFDPSVALSQIADGINAIHERQNDQGKAISDLSNSLDMLRAENSKTRDTEETQADTMALVDSVARDGIASLALKIDTLTQKTTALSDESVVLGRLDDLGGQMQLLSDAAKTPIQSIESLSQMLGELRNDVKRMASAPKPVLDLTEQRRSFATFTTAVSAITQRLEASAEQIGAHLETSKEAEVAEDIMARLNDLHRLQTETEPSIDSLSAQVAALQSTALSETSEIRTLMSELAAKFEAPHPATVDLAPVLEKLEVMNTQSHTLPATLSELQTTIVRIADRPPQTLDLTAQREGFARFATATASVVHRLENCASDLHTLSENAQSETNELRALMQAVIDNVRKLPQDTRDTHVLQDMIAHLQNDIKKLPVEFDEMTEIRNILNTMAKRPDPVLDLTEQRNSFARFLAVTGTSIQRLEQIANTLDKHPKDDDQNGPVLEALQEVLSRIDRETAARGDQLESLSEQIARFFDDAASDDRDRVADDAGAVPPTFNNQMSEEQLRFLFAELVASQLQETQAS